MRGKDHQDDEKIDRNNRESYVNVEETKYFILSPIRYKRNEKKKGEAKSRAFKLKQRSNFCD